MSKRNLPIIAALMATMIVGIVFWFISPDTPPANELPAAATPAHSTVDAEPWERFALSLEREGYRRDYGGNVTQMGLRKPGSPAMWEFNHLPDRPALCRMTYISASGDLDNRRIVQESYLAGNLHRFVPAVLDAQLTSALNFLCAVHEHYEQDSPAAAKREAAKRASDALIDDDIMRVILKGDIEGYTYDLTFQDDGKQVAVSVSCSIAY